MLVTGEWWNPNAFLPLQVFQLRFLTLIVGIGKNDPEFLRKDRQGQRCGNVENGRESKISKGGEGPESDC